MSKQKQTPKPIMLDLYESGKINIYDMLIGKLAAILGMTGSGKSNTAARVIEQILDLKIGLTILDIEGEYWGLQEKYEVLIVGNSKKATVKIDEETFEKMASSLAEKVLTENIPLIIDLSGWSDKKWDLGLIEYFSSLFTIAQKVRRPHIILIEEAQEFVPQSISSDLKEVLVRVAKRGRKRGLFTILASQRSPDVDKKLLSQCEVVFCHRVSHPTDLDVYYKLIPLERKEIKNRVIGLDDGQCFLKLKSGTTVVQVKMRETFHAGNTPGIGVQPKTPPLKMIAKDLAIAFKKMAKSTRKEKDLLEKKENEIKRLSNLNFGYEKDILNLEQQLQIASRIKVEVELPKTIQKMIVSQFHSKGDPTLIPNDANYLQDSNNGLKLNDSIIRKIKSVKRSLKKQNHRGFIIMNFLEANVPDRFNTSRLASRLGFSKGQLFSGETKLMVTEGMLIKTPRSKEEIIWHSNLKNWVKEKFEHFENDNYHPLDTIYSIFQDWLADMVKTGDY
ncbi:hypothetical protein LCGC14_0174320 [marine sediment metagenome]|uniref:Helicase HerA central domain-containing protein n=1 Tax=marine sediment metagenome TaxID=412755 RepID=A0A0F9UUZ0_9ZZZZ